ncbi:MAG: FGGY-family carbohydrate kinase [Candidatus Binatia bacterium]|nr:FGGY-family carbohydrate kinase [Candidatus Binatia bacterium]
MRTDPWVLAIDMGTSAVKTALVSTRGEVVGVQTLPITTRFLPGGGAEQDPEEWWARVAQGAQATVREGSDLADNVVAVACTTQWAVTVPVDQCGLPLAPAISWMDSRGAPFVREIVRGWPEISGYAAHKLFTWIRLTGGAPARSGVDGLGHLLFFKHAKPEIYRAAYKFVEPMDYLNARLTGRVAASFGTMFPYWLTDNRDPNRIFYHPRLLAWAGVDEGKLPELRPVNSVLGPLLPEVADLLGLRRDTVVVMGSCDGQSAAIGAGSVRDFVGYFYVGTTAWMSCHVPWKRSDLRHMLTTMPAALAGRYVVTAEQGMAGRCLEVFKDNVLLPSSDPSVAPLDNPYAYLNGLAASVPPGSEKLLFTPWINGVLVPADDARTRSAFVNQTHRTTRAHYVRAVMEGVAFNMRWLRMHVERFVGQRFVDLRFIGGAASSDLWCQIFADVLDCRIVRPAHPRVANAVGAAFAAFATLGILSPEEMEQRIPVEREFLPEPAHRTIYEELFQEFLYLYRRLRPLYRRLNRPGDRGNG